MFLTTFLLLAALLPQEAIDESTAISRIKQAAAALGASESTQGDILRKLKTELFGTEVTVQSAVVGAMGNTKVTHSGWLVWGMNDVLVTVDDAAAESDYRKLGFVFSGERIDGGMRRMLVRQQEVVCEKTYDQLYVSYVLVVPDRESAALRVGGKLNVRFRISAVRIFAGAFEIRGVATAILTAADKKK